MTSLQSISGPLLYYLIGIISILLMIGQTAELFQAIRYKREKKAPDRFLNQLFAVFCAVDRYDGLCHDAIHLAGGRMEVSAF